ncbi:MAG TPA: cytochrome c biogenesis protein CcsA [Burkholderiales bacterium]|nr:cytochrome c biogenesis protein CcsA [Burkholderiales bacterium]
MPDIVIHGIASAMYVGLAWHFWNTRWRTAEAKRGLRAWERVAILAPLALHGWLIYRGIFAAPELRFGFAQALSVMMFLGVILYWIESLFFSLVGMQPLVLGGAALCVLLPYWFPGRSMPGPVSSDFKIHLALALVAYSVFTIALLHAVLMAVADRLLHRRKLTESAGAHPLAGPVASLPPLLTIEQMFFRLVAVAFVLLTLTLGSGMTLSESMFGKAMRFNHETVFAVASWLTFAVLLWGRVFRGWRGRTALRWTIAGFVMVVLANIGTAFVLEVLLHRA